MRISDWSSDVCSSDLRQAAVTVQDRLNRFGDAVSPNLVGTIARHQPNDYAADDRNGHHDRTKSCVRDIDGISGEATEPEKVRGHRDELEQQQGTESSTCANHKRHSGEHQHSPVGAMIGKLMSFGRSEEHTSELQALMRNSYAIFRLKKQKQQP